MRITRCLIRSRSELEITQSATTAFQEEHLLTIISDITDVLSRLGIIDHCTTGYVDIHILTVGTVTLVLAAVAAMLCEDMTLVLQMEERPVVMIATQDHAAAFATVTTIGTTVGVILHMAQVHTTLAALARAAIYLHIVNEIRFHL